MEGPDPSRAGSLSGLHQGTGSSRAPGNLTSASPGKNLLQAQALAQQPHTPRASWQAAAVPDTRAQFPLFSSTAERAFKLHIFHQPHISPHNFSINFPRLLAPFQGPVWQMMSDRLQVMSPYFLSLVFFLTSFAGSGADPTIPSSLVL